MGEFVSDTWRKKRVTRCPVESPPGSFSVKLGKELDGNESEITISKTQDDALLAAAAVDFDTFHDEAVNLGTFYTNFRVSVTVGSETFNERHEFRKMYQDDIT